MTLQVNKIGILTGFTYFVLDAFLEHFFYWLSHYILLRLIRRTTLPQFDY